MNKHQKALRLIERSVGNHGWFNSEDIEPLRELVEKQTPGLDILGQAWIKVDKDAVVHVDERGILVETPENFCHISNYGDISTEFYALNRNMIDAIDLSIKILEERNVGNRLERRGYKFAKYD